MATPRAVVGEHAAAIPPAARDSQDRRSKFLPNGRSNTLGSPFMGTLVSKSGAGVTQR